MNRVAATVRASRGIVLPLSLVMLVMITLLAVVAIRGVTTEERIAANLRSSSVGFEMAELALRHCEEIAWTGQDPTGATKVEDIRFPEASLLGDAWRVPANWSDPARAIAPPVVPTGVAQPRCMIEESLGGGDALKFPKDTRPRVYVVTAQGFGDSTQTNFRTRVQSQLRPPNAFAAP